MQKYLVTGPQPVFDAGPGTELEAEFTAEEEADHLASGRLEIVPREYRVTGASNWRDTAPGGTVEAALTIGQESALLGTHIERARAKPKPETDNKPPAAAGGKTK